MSKCIYTRILSKIIYNCHFRFHAKYSSPIRASFERRFHSDLRNSLRAECGNVQAVFQTAAELLSLGQRRPQSGQSKVLYCALCQDISGKGSLFTFMVAESVF